MFNDFEWDCDKSGCFNKKRRLKFGCFFDVLPGNISFSDLDGIVEYRGNALIIEWKYYDYDYPPTDGDIPKGQRIMFENMSRLGAASIIVVAGNPEDMSVRYIKEYHGGEISRWIPSSHKNLLAAVSAWVAWARNNSKI
jgi:hypothetical protein